MKPFQSYIFEMNKPYEFRIKMASINPKTVMEQIKNTLNTWQLESISAVKSMPIQEHKEFPNWGPCECWTFDVKVAYPATTVTIRQALKERAQLNPDWICVRNLNEAEYTEEAESAGHDHDGALLDVTELKDDPAGQEYAGQKRIGSLLKELESRNFEFAATDTNADKVREPSATKGETTNNPKRVPQGNTDPVGSKQNKIPNPTKG